MQEGAQRAAPWPWGWSQAGYAKAAVGQHWWGLWPGQGGVDRCRVHRAEEGGGLKKPASRCVSSY